MEAAGDAGQDGDIRFVCKPGPGKFKGRIHHAHPCQVHREMMVALQVQAFLQVPLHRFYFRPGSRCQGYFHAHKVLFFRSFRCLFF
jgi:hypothetical protein